MAVDKKVWESERGSISERHKQREEKIKKTDMAT